MPINKPVRLAGETPLPTEYGGWTYRVFEEPSSGKFHAMMVYGDAGKYSASDWKDVLVRVHSACASSELFHATNCECREELEEAMKRIRKEGKGVIIYLDQEGAGNGIAAKVAVYSRIFAWRGGKVVPMKDPKTGEELSMYATYKKLGYEMEKRSFKAAAEMLKERGIRSVRLLTNNPNKVRGLVDEGIRAVPVGLHIKPKNRIVASHLRAKANELGHNISKRHWKI